VRYLTLTLLVILAMPLPSLSQTATCNMRECLGKLPSDHNDGNYHFLTKSRVYKDGRDYIYETCVQNLGTNDLEVYWVIPGPETVVPVGCAIPDFRPHHERKTADTYRGCLRYGAKWVWDRSYFFPHESEMARISEEAGKDCSTHYASEAVSAGISAPVRDITFTMERFGSSVHADFRKTLSKIEFNIDIAVYPEKRIYKTTLSAKFSPAYEKQPNYYSKGFEIRPTDYSGKLLSNAKGEPSGGYFDGQASIVYTLPIPDKPIQKSVRYAVHSMSPYGLMPIDMVRTK